MENQLATFLGYSPLLLMTGPIALAILYKANQMRIQNAGTEVVNAKAGGGSATLSMGAAAARFCMSLVKGLQGEDVVDYAYVAVENGDAEYFAHPVRLGTNGVEEILSYGELSAFEEKAKNDMLETLKKDIKEGVDFMA